MISHGGETDSGDKNLMPSMVVRQQKNQNTCLGSDARNNERDHQIKSTSQATTLDQLFEEAEKRSQQNSNQRTQHCFTQEGLVLPKRVLPVFSHSHQIDGQQDTIKDLNRELKFNQSRGKNVLNQKSELKKAMEKLEANRRKKEAEQERLTRRTSLELRLEERAQRLASKEEGGGGGGASRKDETITY